MMWGNGFTMGGGWLLGLLALLGVILVIVLIVKAFGGARRPNSSTTSMPDSPISPRSRARQLLDERFAAGEINADEYAERLKVLGEGAE